VAGGSEHAADKADESSPQENSNADLTYCRKCKTKLDEWTNRAGDTIVPDAVSVQWLGAVHDLSPFILLTAETRLNMARTLYVLAILLIFRQATGGAEKPTTKQARAAQQEFTNAVRHLDETYSSNHKALSDTYLAALRGALVNAANDSDEAGRILAEIKRVEAEALVTLTKRLEELQRELARLKKQQPAAGNVRVNIPAEATAWNGHHYVVQETTTTVHLAKEHSEQLGGYLARIESAEENAFVHQLISAGQGQAYIIDGTDESTEGVWIFSNGEAMRWDNWQPGEPRNHQGQEHSLEIKRADGSWNDGACGFRRGFVVEWDQ
jgi:hypothetical protein